MSDYDNVKIYAVAVEEGIKFRYELEPGEEPFEVLDLDDGLDELIKFFELAYDAGKDEGWHEGYRQGKEYNARHKYIDSILKTGEDK